MNPFLDPNLLYYWVRHGVDRELAESVRTQVLVHL